MAELHLITDLENLNRTVARGPRALAEAIMSLVEDRVPSQGDRLVVDVLSFGDLESMARRQVALLSQGTHVDRAIFQDFILLQQYLIPPSANDPSTLVYRVIFRREQSFIRPEKGGAVMALAVMLTVGLLAGVLVLIPDRSQAGGETLYG